MWLAILTGKLYRSKLNVAILFLMHWSWILSTIRCQPLDASKDFLTKPLLYLVHLRIFYHTAVPWGVHIEFTLKVLRAQERFNELLNTNSIYCSFITVHLLAGK